MISHYLAILCFLSGAAAGQILRFLVYHWREGRAVRRMMHDIERRRALPRLRG